MLNMELMPCQKPMLECTRSDGEGRSWVELNVPPARHTGLSQERERAVYFAAKSKLALQTWAICFSISGHARTQFLTLLSACAKVALKTAADAYQ